MVASHIHRHRRHTTGHRRPQSHCSVVDHHRRPHRCPDRICTVITVIGVYTASCRCLSHVPTPTQYQTRPHLHLESTDTIDGIVVDFAIAVVVNLIVVSCAGKDTGAAIVAVTVIF